MQGGGPHEPEKQERAEGVGAVCLEFAVSVYVCIVDDCPQLGGSQRFGCRFFVRFVRFPHLGLATKRWENFGTSQAIGR